MAYVALATEDELSEAVGERLLREAGFEVDMKLRRNGAGYLRAKMQSWCEMARNAQLVLLLADLDRAPCPTALRTDWLGRLRLPENLLFRVAVRETEAWLLADSVAMGKLLGARAKLPRDVEALPDPKRALLELAKGASREVRDDLLPEPGAPTPQGLGYNDRLCRVVRECWDPERAAKSSASLAKARRRLLQLAERHGS
jgi:hypothetical protein